MAQENQHDRRIFLEVSKLVLPIAQKYFDELWLPEVKKTQNILGDRSASKKQAMESIQSLSTFKECLECRVKKIFGENIWVELTIPTGQEQCEFNTELDYLFSFFPDTHKFSWKEFLTNKVEISMALLCRYCFVVFGYVPTIDLFNRKFGPRGPEIAFFLERAKI